MINIVEQVIAKIKNTPKDFAPVKSDRFKYFKGLKTKDESIILIGHGVGFFIFKPMISLAINEVELPLSVSEKIKLHKAIDKWLDVVEIEDI